MRPWGSMVALLSERDGGLWPFYALMHAWMRVGDSASWMRVPSGIATVLAVVVTALVARRLAGPLAGALSGALSGVVATRDGRALEGQATIDRVTAGRTRLEQRRFGGVVVQRGVRWSHGVERCP